MPRVETKNKGGGKPRTCGRCGAELVKGERYFTWAFRYGGRQFRCKDHYPRQSELTQSKLSAVYAAVEAAQDNLDDIETQDDARAALEGVGEEVRAVAEEYREAAEAMGAAGAENEERADELEGWADDLDGASFDNDPDDDETDVPKDERVTALRDEVQEYLNGCPV